MSKKNRFSIYDSYPELFAGENPLLTDDDIDNARRFLVNEGAKTAESLEDHIVEHQLGNQAFRMLVRKGESNNTIIAPAEFATGIRGDGWARLNAMRAIIDPFASIILPPQNVLGQNNLRLSRDERRELRQGSSHPFTDRVVKTLEEEGLVSSNIHAIGISQGGPYMTDLASDPRVHTSSLTIFETPDIKKRTALGLTKDFLLSGPNLYKNLEISKLDTEARFLHQKKSNLALFGLSALNADNIAGMLRLRKNSHKDGVMDALEANPGLGVVRGWTARSAISPSYENWEVTEYLKTYYGEQIEGYEFSGPLASHNSTNIHVLVGALARRALSLARAS